MALNPKPQFETLENIIQGINDNTILLPHFQREYVWDRTKQKNLILSVLTNLPASSSLVLLKDTKDEYKCLKIGMRDEEITDFGSGDCWYLLDGQQRFSTLYYAFYNIFSECQEKNKEEYWKLDNKLRKRWYLNFKYEGKSILNYNSLIFSEKNVENLLPEDLDSFIDYEELKISNLKSETEDLVQIEEQCKNNQRIPLFFILNNKVELKKILKKIFIDRMNEIQSHSKWEKEFIKILKNKGFSDTENKVKSFYEGNDEIIKEIELFIEEQCIKDDWVDGIYDHLKSYVKEYKITPIPMYDRSKAVKTFEYINTGGTNLSSFDLLCAKVASIDLRKKVIDETRKPFKYFTYDFESKDNYELIDTFGLIVGSEKNPSVVKKYAEYLSQVLNLLHFKSLNKNPNENNFKSSLLKTKYSLDELEPKFIEENYKIAVNVIKKSAALLQVFCGHRDIKSITNYLSLIQVFTFFIYAEDNQVISKNLKKLVGLFWLKLFVGKYDSHQNENSIEDTIDMYHLIFESDKKVKEKLKNLINNKLLDVDNFANEELLTSQKCNKSLEDNIYKFIRSQNEKFYDLDSFKESVIEIDDDIEIHHIIPLGTANTVGQSSAEIRRKDIHLLNATMNKTPIKKTTNKTIGAKPVKQYSKNLKDFSIKFSHHLIDEQWADVIYDKSEEDKIKKLFKGRFRILKNNLTTKINSFID